MEKVDFKKICEQENSDLQVHTKYSHDSFASPKKIVEFANKHKKVIAITDHDEIAGALEAKKYDTENRIIIGEEIRMTDIGGEILAYNIKEKIEPGPALEVIENIHQQGGMAVFSHPFKKGYIFTSKKIKVFPPEVIEKIDGVEVWNARNSDSENKKALGFAEKYGKIKTRGSDAHMLWELRIADRNYMPVNLFKNFLTLIIKGVKKLF